MEGDPAVRAASACPGGFHLVAAEGDVHVWGGGRQIITEASGVGLLARLTAPDGVSIDELESPEVEMVAALATADLVTLTRP